MGIRFGRGPLNVFALVRRIRRNEDRVSVGVPKFSVVVTAFRESFRATTLAVRSAAFVRYQGCLSLFGCLGHVANGRGSPGERLLFCRSSILGLWANCGVGAGHGIFAYVRARGSAGEAVCRSFRPFCLLPSRWLYV